MLQYSTEKVKSKTPHSSAHELLCNVSEAELITFLLYISLSLNLFLGLSVQCREEQCENSCGIWLGAEGWRVSFPGITTSCAEHACEPWTKLTEANSQVFSATEFTHNIKEQWTENTFCCTISAACMLQQSWLIFHPGEKEGKKWSKKFLQHLNWIYSCWKLLVLCFTPSFHWQETVNSQAFSKAPKRGGSLLDRVISLARSSADNHFHWRCCKVAHNSFLLYNKCRTIKSSTPRYCAQKCGTIYHCCLYITA